MLFWKKKKTPPPPEEGKTNEVDFAERIAELQKLSNSAQTTFMYRYIGTMPADMCRTVLRYVKGRLNSQKNEDDRSSSIRAEADGKPRTGAKLHYTGDKNRIAEYPLTPKDAYPNGSFNSGTGGKDNW